MSDGLLDVCPADMSEVREEALEYFSRKLLEDSSIESARRRLYWELHEGIGYQFGDTDDEEDLAKTFSGDCELVSDWLDEQSFAYWAWTAVDENGDFVEGPTERLYANDFKADIVGREVAQYV